VIWVRAGIGKTGVTGGIPAESHGGVLIQREWSILDMLKPGGNGKEKGTSEYAQHLR
jgi:hypothetical protein